MRDVRIGRTWVMVDTFSGITRRIQRAGHTSRRPLRWRDGFCLRLRGHRCLLVAFGVPRA